MELLQQLDLPSMSDSSDTDDFLQELAALNDVGLLRATMESLECGRLTPLIKEELRCRIQSRRLSEGKEELLVDFPSPTPSQPRPDEVEKRDRRREQNRRAAQKFRKKKKERGEHLIEETQRLECHNTTLRSEIKQLHQEREQLTRIIQNHASICPLTPRQSPLTIIRESPLPTSIRESPIPLASYSGNILAQSPVLVQSPAILVPPTRESPVPLLIINQARESPIPSSLIPSSPIPSSLIPSSPIPMTSRPRKSPVSLLRINQSPIPGDKSPILFGSPPKQSKHSIPPRLNLAGPKPVIPILPKPSPASLQSSPSPKTPKTIITSPLPIAPSPGRAVHASPVFFRESCFTPSGHVRQVSQSPVSDGSSSSTPARMTQQSPVFFGERPHSSVAHGSSHFLQPLSASSTSSSSSSMSSASSLATLLRQESPLSVLSSSSSSLSQPSSMFASNASSTNTNHRMEDSSSDHKLNINTELGLSKVSQYQCSTHFAVRQNSEDNALSLEEIEKSAAGFEARDDLIDLVDIQALLELSSDHNSAGENRNSSQSQGHFRCPLPQQPKNDMDSQPASQDEMTNCGGHRDSALLMESNKHSCDSAHGHPSDGIRQPRDNIRNHSCESAHSQPNQNIRTFTTSSASGGQKLCASVLTQNFSSVSGSSVDYRQPNPLPPSMDRQGTCSSSSAFREQPQVHFLDSNRHTAFAASPLTASKEPAAQNFRDSQTRNLLSAAIIQHIQGQLRDLISRGQLSESNILRALNMAGLVEGTNLDKELTGGLIPPPDPVGGLDLADCDLLSLTSSLPLDLFMTSHGACGASHDSEFSQATHQ